MNILPMLAMYFFGYIYCNTYFVEKYKIHLQKNSQNFIYLTLIGLYIWVFLTLVTYLYSNSSGDMKYQEISDFIVSYFIVKETNTAIQLMNSQNINILAIGIIFSFAIGLLRNILIFIFETRGFELARKTSFRFSILQFKITCLHKVYIEDKFKELLIRSIREKLLDRFVMFDMSNKKVYVGIVDEIGMPDENYIPNQYVIYPILSGYRDDKGRVVFTTDYRKNIKSKTYIKDENIISIKEFSFNQYDDINSKKITSNFKNEKSYVNEN